MTAINDVNLKRQFFATLSYMWDILKRKKTLSLSNSRQVDGRANCVKLLGLIGQIARARHGHYHSHRISTASAETQFSIVHRVGVDVTAVVEAAVE
ncbi:hypothetical protein T12_5653 [Trichinella patagoniensis]|uniref:Uncharacterized protein n=1 Tax=Trichinella patagoniensis TaxID=990121 RepID=A0A0V1A2X9_9BILA|nr:hypothetical protein T12_5653 [Trichinella patagoniensis]